MRKLRVLISSNGFHTPSGYGSQLAEIIPYFKEDTDVAVSSFYGLQGGEVTLDGVKVYPAVDNDPFGSQAMILHSRDFQADVVITNQDTWPLDQGVFQYVKNIIPWVPIDHQPVPEVIAQRLRLSYRVACYSFFGVEQLAQKGIAATYIPMGVNTQIFKPMNKSIVRKKWGLPEDHYIFGMVAANRDNPSRKSFQEVMDAFAQFVKINPQSLLYTHCWIDAPGAFPIRDYARFLGIEQHLRYDDHYNVLYKYPKARVAELMNCFDVLVLPSKNEGFGIPLIEAQACGVPVITTNFSSMPELVGKDCGWLVEPVQMIWDQLQAYISIPSTALIFQRMEESHKANREKMGKMARKWVVNNFDTKRIYHQYWKPYLDKLASEVVT